MNNIQILAQKEVLGKQFTIYGDFENPLFLAKDVAEWIDYSKSGNGSYNVNRMLSGIDEEEKLVVKVLVAGQNRDVLAVTEDGLYEVLMQSTKPIAKQFKKQVKEILKEIRKKGIYATDAKKAELLSNPDTWQALLDNWRAEIEKNKHLTTTNKLLSKQIERDSSKVLFADAVSASHTSILVGDLAKLLKQNGIDIGANRLFERLRNDGFLMKTGESKNMPTQRAMELGLFEVKERTINNPDGSIRITKTPKVTGKGQQYFVEYFLKKAKSGYFNKPASKVNTLTTKQ